MGGKGRNMEERNIQWVKQNKYIYIYIMVGGDCEKKGGEVNGREKKEFVAALLLFFIIEMKYE
jgi:hypothetical protein